MGVANVPFPSFTLVLTSGRVVIPGPSSVRAMPAVHQTPPKNLMSTIHHDGVEVEERNFLLNLKNASAVVVHFETGKEVEAISNTVSPVMEESVGLQIGETVIVQSSKRGPARFFLKSVETLSS